MPVTYSLHKIYGERNFDFHPDDYSRFKFGDGAIAKKFGESLADGFIREQLAGQPSRQQMVVVPSPYAFIPTATFAMKNHFVFRLNRWLARHHLPVVQEAKVHRTTTYKEDYGELNAEQRIKLIGNDSFHIDKAFIKDKMILFLDDIRITGSHEKMIMRMSEQYGLTNNMYLLYFAELINTEVHPNIENFLNYHYVKSIFDLPSIVQSDSFFINTRIIKYILNTAPEDCKAFLQHQSRHFVNLLYDMALGNGYHTLEAYQQNMNWIMKYLDAKETTEQQRFVKS